jgi:hypothetical protein
VGLSPNRSLSAYNYKDYNYKEQLNIVPATRTILVIAGISTLFFQELVLEADFTSPASQSEGTVANTHFHWNWKAWQELSAEQSLRAAKLTYQRRKAIATAIADQIRPMMADLEIQSETQLHKAALDTRVKMVDLNGDGVPEIVAQGMVNCGATGNCPFWVFRKARLGYNLLLAGEAQTFTIQTSGASRFRDIVLARHGSYSSGDLIHYKYHQGAYQEVGCYDYDWTVLEGDKVRELKEPRITPCYERNK